MKIPEIKADGILILEKTYFDTIKQIKINASKAAILSNDICYFHNIDVETQVVL